MLDLALVPDRFNSWAALALASGSRLETKLNSCERLKNIGLFLDRAESVLRCYRRALSLRPFQITLWIEQGSTAYMLSSHCARLLRHKTDSLSIELFERLELEKVRMLDIAHDCFEAADKAWLADVGKDSTSGDQDERWLHHYMLGKVAEKRGKPVAELLEHYQNAATLIEEASACYPRKISYNTAPFLSVEALEVYYRIHSNILKTLLAHEDHTIEPSLLRILENHLKKSANSLFTKECRRNSIEDSREAKEKENNKRK